MLTALSIRDLVLIEAMELALGPGLTVLTGETGAGKSIVLGALALATGGKAEGSMARPGAAQASVAAVFEPGPDSPLWALVAERGFAAEPGEPLVLRRVLLADGRSRAFVADQAAGLAALRELGEALTEIHGQHAAVGLMQAKSHRGRLDAFAGLEAEARAAAEAWGAWRAAAAATGEARVIAEAASQTRADLVRRLGELDRLAPRPGEEAALAAERVLLGAAEKTLAEIAQARRALGEDAGSGAAAAARALGRARERARAAGAEEAGGAMARLAAAAEAAERALVELREAEAAIEAAAEAFQFEPDSLERAEERLFALRAAARAAGVTVEELPGERDRLAGALAEAEDAQAGLARAAAAEGEARTRWRAKAQALGDRRRRAAAALTAAVMAEFPPLKLEKARFEVAVEALEEEAAGAGGLERVEFRFAGLPGAAPGPLSVIASGGELARLALALKVALASASEPAVMVFDEVDQGVGGAAADAVGRRLKRLAERGQVLVVTHSPQIAARADAHWRIDRAGATASIERLEGAAREEEIARMLSGERITEEARAAARALIAA